MWHTPFFSAFDFFFGIGVAPYLYEKHFTKRSRSQVTCLDSE